MPTRLDVGRYVEGKWQSFETADLELDDIRQAKLAAEGKAKIGVPIWAGATHIRVRLNDESAPYELSYPYGSTPHWSR